MSKLDIDISKNSYLNDDSFLANHLFVSMRFDIFQGWPCFYFQFILAFLFY